MKKIALLAPYWRYGGAEKQFRYLVEALASTNADVEIKVFVLGGGSDTGGMSNVSFSSFGCDPANVKDLNLFLSIIRLLWQLLMFRPSICYFYSLYLMPVSIFRLFGCRVIYSERILSDQTRSRYKLYKFLSMFWSDLIVNSMTQVAFFKPFYPKCKFIPNRVDSVDFESKERGGNTACVISRLSREKNIEYVRFIDNFYSVDVYSSSRDLEYAPALVARMSEASNGGVSFHDAAPLNEIYRKSSFLIHPSKSEGCPNVILEAMASGFPFFCSRIPEHEELRLPEELYFRLDDRGVELNNKLSSWSNLDSEYKKKLIDKCRKLSKPYSKEVFRANIQQLFGVE